MVNGALDLFNTYVESSGKGPAPGIPPLSVRSFLYLRIIASNTKHQKFKYHSPKMGGMMVSVFGEL